MDVLGRFAENAKTGDDNYNLYDIPTNTSDVEEIEDQKRKYNELPGIHLSNL